MAAIAAKTFFLAALLIASAACVAEAKAPAKIKLVQFMARMGGKFQVGAKDPNATGSALLRLYVQGTKFVKLQYVVTAKGVTGVMPPMFQALYNNGTGKVGPKVLDLTGPWKNITATAKSEYNPVFRLVGVNTNTTALKVFTNILKAPAQYYVNVFTSAYPMGAIRGQLFRTKA